MTDRTAEIVELFEAKCSALERYRDLFKAQAVRLAAELERSGEREVQLLAVIEDIASGKLDAASLRSEDLLPKHPEVVDAERKQPALLPHLLQNGLYAQFSTREETQEVADAYAGSEPEFRLGVWNTKIGALAPEDERQYLAHLFVLTNPNYYPAHSVPPAVSEDE